MLPSVCCQDHSRVVFVFRAVAETDLLRFIEKVSQLQALAAEIDSDPTRRSELASCTDHNQVVELTRAWGYDIGRRWGEADGVAMSSDNLFRMECPEPGAEIKRRLATGDGWSLMLISSNAYASPEGEWFDQVENEWVLVLRGSARLRLSAPDRFLDLSAGDHLMIPPHQRHRLVRTDSDPGTLWLALHWLV